VLRRFVRLAQITIILKSYEKDVLYMLAEREFRDPRAQAALIIRHELERRGLFEKPNDQILESTNAPEFEGYMKEH
jgi:hypothetical protein